MLTWFVHYWMQVVFGFVVTAITYACKTQMNKNKNIESRQNALILGIQALLRSEIIREYNKWIDAEFIPIYALDNIEILHKQYCDLGGEPPVTGLVEKLRDLPTKKK